MIWQDMVIGGGQWFFALALIPMLRSETKPPLVTSLPTGVALLVFAGTFLTLDLWHSALSSAVVGAMWLIIAWQRWRHK